MRSFLSSLVVVILAVSAARAQVVFDQGVDASGVVKQLAPGGIRIHLGWTPACRVAVFEPGGPQTRTFVLRTLEMIEECASLGGECTISYENPIVTAFQVIDGRADTHRPESVKVCLSGWGVTANALKEPSLTTVSIEPAAPGQSVIRLTSSRIPEVLRPVEPGRPEPPREQPQAP